MTRSTGSALAITVVVLQALTIAGCGYPTSAEAEDRTGSRKSVELTIYAQDFAMVKESRPEVLGKGTNSFAVTEVSRQMDPQSVLLRWSGDTDALPEIVSQVYDLGVTEGDALLKRYLGKNVEVVRYGQDGKEAERQSGKLMVQGNGDTVLQSDGKFYVRPEGTIVAAATADVVTIPQLRVQAESPAKQAADLEVAYLTRGLSWSADYVATLDPKSDKLALECWATVVNQTGIDYPDAKVALVAGSPNRAVVPMATVPALTLPGRRQGFMDGSSKNMMGGGGGRAFGDAETSGEFHLYPIVKPTVIRQEQMNRLKMLGAKSVEIKRDYSTRPPRLDPYDYYGYSGSLQKGSVQVALTFFNRSLDGLGMPLPHGALRIYESDSSGSLRYAGAASISDTPKDQKINVTLARAFDIFTQSRVLKTEKIGKRTVRRHIEIVLHNEKATSVDVRVVQLFGGQWKIVSESHPHAKLDASNGQWKVNIPAGKETVLTYVAEFKW